VNPILGYRSVIFVSLMILIWPSGCDRCGSRRVDEPGLGTRALWIKNFKTSLAHGRYAAEDADRLNSLVHELESTAGPIGPRLWSAHWIVHDREGTYWLSVLFYDEQKIVESIRVREHDTDQGRMIVEDYELFPGGRNRGLLADDILVPFSVRTGHQLKDEQAWAAYAEENIRTRERMPPIWISIPTSSVQVTISLVDANGEESKRLPLLPQSARAFRGTSNEDE